MFVDELTQRGPMPLLERTLSFLEQRQRVLAENIANVDTPGYRARQLDPKAFQAALRSAADERQRRGTPALHLAGTKQFHETPTGRLVVTPTLEPLDNLLFQDGTNARIEREMSRLAENGMTHRLVVELIRGQIGDLMKAISGRV
ncbi:MAG: flagellar basal body rod protein FlgB [Phycisphaerae bacterium]